MTQGINKCYIFEKADDIKYYIKLMNELKKEYKIKLIAYCVMNNHAHMLIETEKIDELSKYMHRINCMYGRYYNRKYNRVGYVFRNRFKSEGIYNDEQLYNCIKYIYDNPVKAGICNKAEEYAYSNYMNINQEVEDNYDYVFMDVDDEPKDCEEAINDFLREKDIRLYELVSNGEKLKELIKSLKDDYKVSLRKISENLNIGRETIRKIYLEKCCQKERPHDKLRQ